MGFFNYIYEYQCQMFNCDTVFYTKSTYNNPACVSCEKRNAKLLNEIEILNFKQRVLPQAIESTEPAQAEGKIITEDMVNGNDCPNGQC